MIGPEEIRAKAERLYAKYLSSIVSGVNLFPLNLTFAKVRSGEAAARWSELMKEMDRLKASSDETLPGRSYRVVWEDRRDKLAGSQSFPAEIFFPDEAAYLGYLGKLREVERFRVDLELLLGVFPVLKQWINAKPLSVVERSGEWPRIISVLSWLRDNPASGLYLREIPAVEDTKFIEARRGLIRELLDHICPCAASAIASDGVVSPVKSFEDRCGLKSPQPIVRVRILDRSISNTRLSGIDDISVPIDEMDCLNFPEITRILIVENKTVFLTIPPIRGTLAIFGSGYASRNLGSLSWMASRYIGYWGDIDSHGLRILGDFRLVFTQTQSILMDDGTFDRFPEYHSDAPIDEAAIPGGLTELEQALYRRLVSLKEKNRLEQERIPFQFIQQKLVVWAMR